AVFNDQDPLASDLVAVYDGDWGCGFDDYCVRSAFGDILADDVDALGGSGFHLVDDDYVSHAQVDFAGMIADFVAGAMGVNQGD
ncbi:MAG TPA: hypothetical protein DG577_04825, partial [Firmicutes bacterium]|nr:hypothetical protein [Bacillota bacterium]